MTAPDFKVEIAFNAGWSTAAGSRTWTDVTAYVEPQPSNIGFGRTNELSACEANSVSLTLVNDGRFTPGKASGAYYPNVKIGRPLRITSTPSGEAASVRFLGYIDSWRTQWPGGGESYATVDISANSRLARLGLPTRLKSIVEQEILADDPVVCYTLGEADGATFASDSSGNGAPRLVQSGSGTAVVFGTATGPGTDGLTAATFAGGKYLVPASPLSASAPVTHEVFFNTTSTSVGMLRFAGAGGLNIVANKVEVAAHGGLGAPKVTSAATYADGLTHHAAVTVDGSGNAALFVDGVSQGTNGGFTSSMVLAAVGTGGSDSLTPIDPFTGALAHAASFPSVLSSTRIAAHANSGLTGFADETPAARLTRYAGYGKVPAAETSFETGETLMAHIDTTGLGVVDALRRVEETEGGVLFDARDGTLTFHDRAHRYGATAALTLSAAQQKLGADFRPDLDRTALINTSTATNADGTEIAPAVNATSVDDYGEHSKDFTLDTTVDEEPFQRAWWTVNTYGTPDDRVPTLVIDLEGLTAAEQTTVLDLTVGSRIDVTNLPTQAAASSASYFAEGATETIGVGVHRIVFNVSPAEPWLNVWTIEDAVYGQYDAYGLAY